MRVTTAQLYWIWSGARDQESTNHGAHFVEWKSSYITNNHITNNPLDFISGLLTIFTSPSATESQIFSSQFNLTQSLSIFIIWLALRAGKMAQNAHCDWVPERARWSARSGLPAVSRKQNYPESHIMNPLLTKFAGSRWLDIGLVHFFASLWTRKKGTWPLSSHLSWPHT